MCHTLAKLREIWQHSDPHKSAISKHLCECDYASYLFNMHNLFDNLNASDSDKTDTSYYSHAELILNNTKILQSLNHNNSNLLLYLEALHIKHNKPELNNGLKASKELVVFP